jgi:hypothetical protein
MTRPDPVRRRRCHALALAMVLGVLLIAFERTWIALGGGLAGIAVLLLVWLRECRGEDDTDSTQSGTHAGIGPR